MRGIMVCIYVPMYHLPHVCRTLVPEIRVHPKMLHVFRGAHMRELQVHVQLARTTGVVLAKLLIVL